MRHFRPMPHAAHNVPLRQTSRVASSSDHIHPPFRLYQGFVILTLDSFEPLEEDFRQRAHPPATHFIDRAARFLDLFSALKIWAVFAQLRVRPTDDSTDEQTNCNFKCVYSSNTLFNSFLRDSDAGVASARLDHFHRMQISSV